jgi:hypothetical protein
LFTSPFEKGGLRGIYLIKSPLTLFFKEGGLNNYKIVTEKTATHFKNIDWINHG